MEKSPALDGHGNARRGSRAFAAVRCGGRPQGQTPAETQTPPTPGAAIYPVSGSVPAASSIRATQAKRANPNQTIMNETICSITSAIEEGHSWGHSDEAIALLQDMKRSIQIRAAQVVSAHSKQGATDARQLLW